MASVEILILGEESNIGTAVLHANIKGAEEAGLEVAVTSKYEGNSDWLCIYGSGERKRNAARLAHIRTGRKAACWDLGYVESGKDREKSYVRVSVNELHPTSLMGKTPNDPQRWLAHGIELREDYDPKGRVIVVGLGPKSRSFLNLSDWEMKALRSAKLRFPEHEVLYRPKPQGLRDPHIIWPLRDGTSPIEELLKGASLVICRHSNVAVDACIAGVPVTCEAGAAYWLYADRRMPTRDRRLDFLCRLMHWQWKLGEMADAWKFLTKITS